MPEQREIVLKVFDIRKRHLFPAVVQLDSQAMTALDIRSGDVVEIEGTKISAGTVQSTEKNWDVEVDAIGLSSCLRKNLEVNLGDEVTVRKACGKVGKSIVMAPISISVRGGSFGAHLRRKLLNYPLMVGNIVDIRIGISRIIEMVIVSTEPEGICIVKPHTNICITTQRFDASFQKNDYEIQKTQETRGPNTTYLILLSIAIIAVSFVGLGIFTIKSLYIYLLIVGLFTFCFGMYLQFSKKGLKA